MNGGFTRREALRMGGALGLLAATSGRIPAGAAASTLAGEPPSIGGRTVVARIAHLTDLHIQPELEATEGVRACLAHVGSLAEKPDLIMTGGDLIMDGFEADEARTRVQWELVTKTFRDHAPVPVRHCLGNHDIWGWNKSKSRTNGSEPGWGKQWAVQETAMPGRFHSFDVGSGPSKWHITVLDSTQVDPRDANGYIGLVDEEQWTWLERDLAEHAALPTLIVSHIPIISATVLARDADPKTHVRRIEGGLIHTDSGRLLSLFGKGRSAGAGVRACVSGHLHQIDRVDIRGASFFCNGAVCGKWWKGANGECREGYALLTLFDDGTLDREYITYGWQAPRQAMP